MPVAQGPQGQFFADAQLTLPTPMTPATAARFLNLVTVDVQQTQFDVAVDATAVDFSRVAAIGLEIVFASLPGLTPIRFSLSKTLLTDSARILVPLENAVFALPCSIIVTMNPSDASAQPVRFTMTNDFIVQPLFELTQAAIDAIKGAA